MFFLKRVLRAKELERDGIQREWGRQLKNGTVVVKKLIRRLIKYEWPTSGTPRRFYEKDPFSGDIFRICSNR